MFGENAFDPIVTVASVEPNSSPLGSMAAFGTAALRPGDQFTGVPYQGLLGEAERSKMRRVGLPTSGIVRGIHPLVASHSFRPGETISPVEQTLAFAIAEENELNSEATRLASNLNNAENVNANANAFIRNMPDRIRRQQEEEKERQIQLAELFAHLPTAQQKKDLQRAAAAAAQSAALASAAGGGGSRLSLLERFASPPKTVVSSSPLLQGLKTHPSLVVRPLTPRPYGGRSRKYHRKMRKSRKKRGTRRH